MAARAVDWVAVARGVLGQAAEVRGADLVVEADLKAAEKWERVVVPVGMVGSGGGRAAVGGAQLQQ